MNLASPLLDAATHLLECDEREAVLGDLTEAGESAWRGLLDILGLIVRRQAMLWKTWQPWAAAFGLALPASFLLMGFSLGVSWSFVTGAGLWLLVSHLFLLIAWSWSGGFVVGSLSRRTLWVSIASSCLPCLFCLARFRGSSLPRLCLLIFLAPAIAGICQGLRTARIKLRSAMVLAVSVSALMLAAGGSWTLQWILIWPAWYLVVEARKAT
jgi:hypothetical protein